ncbi:MAG: STAS domain-containing protein [Chloroflexi bacterium]|nr:STAS domain-containing protein [Chloroflexota bacterium]
MNITTTLETSRVSVTVFQIHGNVDASNYSELQTRVQEAIQAGMHYILLDLSDVPYMSSAGLRALNQIFNWVRAHAPDESDAAVSQGLASGKFKSQHLKLLNPTPRVLDVLKTAGIDMFLEIHTNRQNALVSFEPGK